LFSENGAECEAVIDKAVPLTAGVYKKTPVDIVQQTDPDEHEPGNIIEELQSPHFTDIQSEGTSEMQQIDVPIDTVKPFQSVADNQRKYYPKRTRVKTVIYTNTHDDDNDNIPKPVPKPKKAVLLQPSTKKMQKQPHAVDDNMKSYADDDAELNDIQAFTPARTVGPQLNSNQLRGMKNALDFFSLFFDDQVISKIVKHTNEYGYQTIHNKSTYANDNGGWVETSSQEIRKLIALLLYQGLVRVSSFKSYWSTKSLYHGLWARDFMSRNRYSALMSMIHIVDPSTENKEDKLRKVSEFANIIKEKCMTLYQPHKNVSIDERIVKSKHRSGIRQYIKNKPVKFGLKLWVLADSRNGYTVDFNIYAGKNGDEPIHENGLGYHVVVKLMEPFFGQGYHLFTDNFYSSCLLFSDLFSEGVYCCGTVTENRRGFPEPLKGGKIWIRKKRRGEMRWLREKPYLALQWKDNKVVTMLSTIHKATDFVMVKRKEKVDGKWEGIDVKQPKVIAEYNSYMNGVDKSDQILSSHNLLRKCFRWWKTLFFHLIDISVVNSFILFDESRKHDKREEFRRPSGYSLLHFREELVRNIMDLPEYANPPVYVVKVPRKNVVTAHLPSFTKERRNCKVCYDKTKKQNKVNCFCSAPECGIYLHCNGNLNCFAEWHSESYHN